MDIVPALGGWGSYRISQTQKLGASLCTKHDSRIN